ncbi:hypothetical protein D9M68_240750 [compost metagenome]
MLDDQGDRAVGVGLQAVGGAADAVAAEVVLDEVHVRAVQRQVPEHRRRRLLALGEAQHVPVLAAQGVALVVDFGVRVVDLLGVLRADHVPGQRRAQREVVAGAAAEHEVAPAIGDFAGVLPALGDDLLAGLRRAGQAAQGGRVQRAPVEAAGDAQADGAEAVDQRLVAVAGGGQEFLHGLAEIIEEAHVLRRGADVVGRQLGLRRLVGKALALVGRQRHQLKALLRLDGERDLGRGGGVDARGDDGEVGARLDQLHAGRHHAAETGCDDQVVARLRAGVAADIGRHLVQHVADLGQRPALFRQLRYVEHEGFAAQVEARVGIDGHVVGRDDGAVPGGLQLGVLAEAVQVDHAGLDAAQPAHVVADQRIAPGVGLDAQCVGVLFAGLLGGHRACRLCVGGQRRGVGGNKQGKTEAQGQCEFRSCHCRSRSNWKRKAKAGADGSAPAPRDITASGRRFPS